MSDLTRAQLDQHDAVDNAICEFIGQALGLPDGTVDYFDADVHETVGEIRDLLIQIAPKYGKTEMELYPYLELEVTETELDAAVHAAGLEMARTHQDPPVVSLDTFCLAGRHDECMNNDCECGCHAPFAELKAWASQFIPKRGKA